MSGTDTEMQAGESVGGAVVGGIGRKRRVHVRTGGPLGSIAEQLLGEDTPENRHHLWDWNRDILPTPEAVVPSGCDLNIMEPGFKSGGPTLGALKRADLTSSDLAKAGGTAGGGSNVESGKNSIGMRLALKGDATPPEGEDLSGLGSEATGARMSQNRREMAGDRQGDVKPDPEHENVGRGSDGALAQADQDREQAREGNAQTSDGATGSASGLPTGAEGGAGGGGEGDAGFSA